MISYPYTSKPNIDINKAFKMSLEGIDVFNSSDPFFNDPCYSYTVNNSYLALEDRRKEYYQNITLCESNCKYKGMYFESNRIQCKCNTKYDFITNKRAPEIIQNNNNKYSSSIKAINFVILKCYMKFVIQKEKLNNLGFMFTIFILFFELLSFLFKKNNVFSFISKHQENSPPQASHNLSNKYNVLNYNNSISYKVHTLYNENESNCQDSNNFNKESKEKEIALQKELKELKNKYAKYTSDIDNYPFHVALLLDKRNWCNIFIKITQENNILFRLFRQKSKYELVSLNLSYFLFFLGLLFSVNAVFYDESLISKRYHNEITYKDFLIRMILSLLITYIIMKIVYFFKYNAPLFDLLEIEIKDSTVLNEYIAKQITNIKNKIIVFYIIIMLCTLFFIYYLTIFCVVYNTIQMSI